ncbi:LacI family DNA-binding transcriptional regulator [Stenotrophomonas rhizophila]
MANRPAPGQPPHRPATLKTVADRTGVSSMTVSNVINGTGKVGAETRARVKEAIRATGYVPNLQARRLAGAAGTRIALIHSGDRSPFLTDSLLAVLASTHMAGAQLIVCEGTSATLEDAEQLVMDAVKAGAEGLILIPPYAERLSNSDTFMRLRMPAIALAGAQALPGMQTVRIDNRLAADQLASHLIDSGHQRIAFLAGPMEHGDSRERLAGFEDAMARAGLPIAPELVRYGRFSFQSGCDIGEDLLGASSAPSAVLASNDDMALGVLWVAHRAGLRIPQDLSLAAFDDTAAARRAWPPLTVANQPMAAMAATATQALLDCLTGDAGLPQGEQVLPHHVIIRRSSESVTAPCN